MVSDSEVLIALNEILQDYETVVIKGGSRVTKIRIITGEREDTRTKIHDQLTRRRIIFQNRKTSESSFEGTQIQTSEGEIQLIYKRKSGGGSGAGAALTKLSESSQCLYAAIAFGLGRKITNGDVNSKNAARFSNLYSTDEDTNKMLNDLPDDWIDSCVIGANKLFDTFHNKGNYVFHRGSDLVNLIELNFKRIKKLEKIRMDLNKWSPADIYMIRNDFDINCLFKERTILGLNQCMQERIQNNTCMGVSLKKIRTRATIQLKNISSTSATSKTYVGYDYSDTSMDCYIKMSGGVKIQFRSFGGPGSLTGWQGEIKGSQANQGKISLGPLNMILKNYGLPAIPTDAANRVRNKSSRQQVIVEIINGFKKYTNANISKASSTIFDATDAWLYSKLQATQLLDRIVGMNNSETRNELIEDLYLYASSQSKYSAPYYKLE